MTRVFRPVRSSVMLSFCLLHLLQLTWVQFGRLVSVCQIRKLRSRREVFRGSVSVPGCPCQHLEPKGATEPMNQPVPSLQ